MSAAASTGVMALVLAACSVLAGGEDPATAAPIRVGAFDFTESILLAHIYAGALRAEGYRVEGPTALGSRETVTPALLEGRIDLYPGYAASDLEFLNGGAGEASSDIGSTLQRLRERLEVHGSTALDASPVVDTNAFAVTRATAQRHGLQTISDLAPVASSLVLGGPPECPTRPFCLPGLEHTYGVRFRDFRALDAGGPLSKDALEKGDVDVALVLSTDGAVAARGLVILEDDRHLQPAENVVPILRKQVATSRVRNTLDKVSSKLRTTDVATLNERSGNEDPATLAAEWLDANDFSTASDKPANR